MFSKMQKRIKILFVVFIVTALIIGQSLLGSVANGTQLSTTSNSGEVISWPVKISEENFPDPAFMGYVAKNCDKNKNGELEESEALQIETIRANDLGIKSLKGIEYFKNLKILHCRENEITQLDMSKNGNLIELICNGNNISDINLSENPKLQSLECFDNNISHLDLKNNKELMGLGCGGNPMTQLDLSENKHLENFSFLAGNIKEIDLSNNTQLRDLYISGTPLEHLDVSKNTKLETMFVYITNIKTLDLTNNINLKAGSMNLQQNHLIAVHTNMADAGNIIMGDQLPVKVKIAKGQTSFDLKTLDKNIKGEYVIPDGSAEIKDAIVYNISPGMEISYDYVENGINLKAHLIFEEDDSQTEPPVVDPSDPAEPAEPETPDSNTGAEQEPIENNEGFDKNIKNYSGTEKNGYENKTIVETGDDGIGIGAITALAAGSVFAAVMILFGKRYEKNRRK